MKRIVSRDLDGKQRMSGLLQSCLAAALQSAGAVTLDSSVHYKGKKKKNRKFYNVQQVERERCLRFFNIQNQPVNGDDLSLSRLRGATHERSFALVSAVQLLSIF